MVGDLWNMGLLILSKHGYLVFSSKNGHILFPFHLILTSGPILIVNNHQRVVLSWRILSKVVFRHVFY